MARLVGTGKDPRYGKGEVFDVPKYAPVPGGHGVEGAEEREINPTYQELIDSGKAKALDPEKDPGRTPTQIANHLVQTGGALPADPVDAKLADDMDDMDAYAITHTGDASATASDDLKPEDVRSGQRDDKRQFGSGAGVLTEEVVEENDKRSRSGGKSGSGS